MKKLIALSILLCFSTLSFAQTEDDSEEIDDIQFAIIEEVPTFPGCTGNNEAKKACMSRKLSQHIGNNFNMDYIESLDIPAGTHRIFVSFKIDKEGNFVDFKPRGEYEGANNEIVRILKMLPQIEPGYQRGKAVNVLYTVPVVFNLEGDPEEKKSKKLNKNG